MIYNKKDKTERLNILSKTPRMYNFNLNYHNGVNCVDGLVDLCNKYMKETDIVVEIGCFQGISSRTLALHCEELHCVDPWSWSDVYEAEKIFDSILPEYPNIKKIKLPSIEAAKLFADKSIDIVYIDGDHSYESLTQDINTWIPKIKNNGYIAGHDNYIPDVSRAIRDCFGSTYETFSDTSWIVPLK